jgi:hypothetical protein
MYHKVASPQDAELLQQGIDQVESWCKVWLLQPNGLKCKVLHIGQNNIWNKYSICISGTRMDLTETSMEKDPGSMLMKL